VRFIRLSASRARRAHHKSSALVRALLAPAFALGVTLAEREASAQQAPPAQDAGAPDASAGNAAPVDPATVGAPRDTDTPTLGGASRGDRQTRAIAHYERGRVHYASGRYRAAIVELEAAIALSPSMSDLQYDLGLVYERLGRLDAAVVAYRRYQQSTHDAAERERTTRILARLEGAQREPLEFVWGGGRLGRADALFWGFVGGSAGTLVGGSVALTMGVLENGRAGELQRMGNAMGAMAAQGSATGAFVASGALFAVSVGLGTTAGLLYATRQAGVPPTLNGVCLTLAPNGAVGVAGSF
jgi:tetratricopeptide (TPR) repeat protein